MKYSRIRGVHSTVLADGSAGAILRELQSSVQAFKDKQEARVAALEGSLDEINSNLAALRIGGGPGFDPTAGAGRRAISNLGEFGRSGSVEALGRGFTPNAAMRSSEDPAGGYTVPEELSRELMQLQRNDSAMRRLARVITTNSASFKQPISAGGTASGWVGEETARPETSGPSLKMVEIYAGEIYANPAITQNLLDDSAYDLGAYIAGEISDEFNDQEGSAFISGNGINKPRGFLTYDTAATADATRPFGTLQYVPSGNASGFASTDPVDALQDMIFKTKSKYRQRSSWLMNSVTLGTISKFKDSDHNLIWQRNLAAGVPSTLLGYPVEVDEGMPDVGAGEYPVAFGDFNRGYMIADRFGMRILRDALTNKPFVHFYATKRVGGALLDSNAIKLLKIATS